MLKNKYVNLSNDELNLQFNRNSFQNIEVETLTNKIMKNARLKKFTVALLGMSLYFKDVFAAIKGIDALGWTLLTMIRQWAKPILIVWCIVEVIRGGLSGDSKKTLPIMLKFIVIFASMYLIPEIFNAIEAAFR